MRNAGIGRRTRVVFAAMGLLTLSSSACKPKHMANAQLNEAVTPAPSAAGEQGFKLSTFNFDLGNETVRYLSSYIGSPGTPVGRHNDIGCRRASQWMALPITRGAAEQHMPALSDAVKAIAAAPDVGKAAFERLLEPYGTYIHCGNGRGSWPSIGEDGNKVDGIKRLVDAFVYRGYDLSLIIVDGEASLLTPGGALADSRALWQREGPREHFKVLHFSLTNLRDSVEAGIELLEKVGEEDSKPKGELPVAYIFWAEGIAGNLVMEMLGTQSEPAKVIRNSTFGVVTVGTPFGGLLTMQLAEAGLRRATDAAKGVLEGTSAGGSLDVLTTLLSPATNLAPAHRQDYMLNQFKQLDFSVERPAARRPMSNFLHVFHVASVVDLADLTPLPLLSMEGGAMVLKADRNTIGHAAAMAHLPLFMNYPLSDGAVALQHAVIPPEARPRNVEPDLIALLRLDHFALGLTRRDENETPVVPYVEIVDSILTKVRSAL